MKVAGILQTKGADVVTAARGETLSNIARTLDERRIGAVVIVSADGAVEGVVSERDVTREVARRGAAALELPVSDCMTADVVTIGPDASVEEVMACMTDRRVRHLPVIAQGRLGGIVSIGDVVKWRIAEVEAEAAAMRAYIATG